MSFASNVRSFFVEGSKSTGGVFRIVGFAVVAVVAAVGIGYGLYRLTSFIASKVHNKLAERSARRKAAAENKLTQKPEPQQTVKPEVAVANSGKTLLASIAARLASAKATVVNFFSRTKKPEVKPEVVETVEENKETSVAEEAPKEEANATNLEEAKENVETTNNDVPATIPVISATNNPAENKVSEIEEKQEVVDLKISQELQQSQQPQQPQQQQPADIIIETVTISTAPSPTNKSNTEQARQDSSRVDAAPQIISTMQDVPVPIETAKSAPTKQRSFSGRLSQASSYLPGKSLLFGKPKDKSSLSELAADQKGNKKSKQDKKSPSPSLSKI